MANKLLIQPTEVGTLARECNAEEEIVIRAIEESEMNDIRPALGDGVFSAVKANPTKYNTLLNGGEYEVRGVVKVFAGLKTALAYYVWARLAKTSPYHITRFGFVVKGDDYSRQPEWSERQAIYNDAYAIADGYIRDCAEYVKDNPSLFGSLLGANDERNTTRSFTRIIGC